MHKLKIKKKAFTLVETVIVCVIFAMIVSWIILWINRAFAFMNNARVQVRATNFAREWVEMVYNLRDTNRRKYSGEKDKQWLNIGDWSHLFKPWVYIIKEWNSSNWDKYVYAEDLNIVSDKIDNFYDVEWFFSEEYSDKRESSKISFPWTYSYYSGGAIETWNLEDLLWWIDFYRVLRVYGIYKKDVENSDTKCEGDCLKNWTAAELRFCVKVFYEAMGWQHSTELCSIMTNFME